MCVSCEFLAGLLAPAVMNDWLNLLTGVITGVNVIEIVSCFFAIILVFVLWNLSDINQWLFLRSICNLIASVCQLSLSIIGVFYVWLEMLYGCIINNNVSSMYKSMWPIAILHWFSDVLCITITKLDVSCSLQQLCRCCCRRHQRALLYILIQIYSFIWNPCNRICAVIEIVA